MSEAFTEAELNEAFMRVANPTDWRKPICRTLIVKDEREIRAIAQSVELLAGGGCKVQTYRRRSGELSATFRAPGHYALVNRSELSPEERSRLLNGGFIQQVAHAVDVDVQTKTITLRCVRCGRLSLERLPESSSDYEMLRLSVQWSSGASGRVHRCQVCDRPEVPS
jgi:hypothetical protein